jgi:hypothetical protein
MHCFNMLHPAHIQIHIIKTKTMQNNTLLWILINFTGEWKHFYSDYSIYISNFTPFSMQKR